MIAVGKQVKRWKTRNCSNCLMCCAPEEDTEHVLQCKGEAAKDLWEEKQWELVKRMFKIHTNSAMIIGE